MTNKIIAILTMILVVIDQIIKVLCINYLNEPIVLINDFLSLNYVKNYGVGFSLLYGRMPLIIITSVILIGVIVYMLNSLKDQKIYALGLTLMLSGAIGNLIDRILYGYVVDYIDVKIINYDFPVFNFADSILVIGALFVMGYMIYEEVGK